MHAKWHRTVGNAVQLHERKLLWSITAADGSVSACKPGADVVRCISISLSLSLSLSLYTSVGNDGKVRNMDAQELDHMAISNLIYK